MGVLGAVFFFCVFCVLFLQGVASSSSDTMVQYLPPRTMSAPPARVICEPNALEPQLGFSGSHDLGVRRRGCARASSDQLKRLRGGVTGDLLVMRNDALARINIACESYGTIKTNVAQRWEALCRAEHVAENTAPPEMARWARMFKYTLA